MTGDLLAAGIAAPIGLPTAKVLPQGVRNMTFLGVMTAPTERYSASSSIEPLGQDFNQELSFKKILEGELDPIKRGQLRQKMLAAGLDEEDSFGVSLGEVNAQVQASIPVFAMGMTKRWTAAIAVPVKKIRVNIASSVLHSNQSVHAAFANILGNTGAGGKKVEFEDKIGDPINEKLEEYGYAPLEESEEYSRLGDILLINKFKTFENKFHLTTLNMSISLPTGKAADPNKLVDITGGDGQTDLELGVLHDFKLTGPLTLTLAAHYRLQFSDHIDTRVPERRSSRISPDVENNIARDLGDIGKIEAALSFSFVGVTLAAGYGLQYKNADKYTGQAYASERYEWLAKDSVQNMQSLQLFMGYDTVSLYKQKKFFAPMGVGLNHTRILAGKNVVSSPLTTFNFKLFF